MNNKKIIPIITILIIIAAIVGATFAYWSWTSDNANKTNITFTIGADFSCGANGGGNIASSNIAPASCTNSTYAIQREITTTVTNSGSEPVSMDMWLTVNSIGSGLSNSSNFKWTLTTDSTSCSSNVVNEGTFQGKTANSTVTILSGSTASTATYFLYIWLDNAETATTSQNQSYSFSLGGSCTNEVSNEQTVYTANPYDSNVIGWNAVWKGQAIPNSITTYSTPEEAMAAFKTTAGETEDYPFYLMHTIGNYSGWCIIMNGDTSNCLFGAISESDCNTVLSQRAPNDGNTYTCSYITVSNVVTKSYAGFVITPEMASNNPGMVAGTYTLRGGDGGASFMDNVKTIYDAFGGIGCKSDNNEISTPYSSSYTPTPSSDFQCTGSGLTARAHSNGRALAQGYVWSCGVDIINGAGCLD